MPLAREHTEESPEHRLEPVLRIKRREVRHRRLLADYELELGDKVYQKLAVQTGCIPNRVSPAPDPRFILAQNLADQGLESLRKSGVWDVALVLVDFARNENAARQNDCPVQLVHDRGFTDARVAGYEYQLRRASGHNPLEGFEQLRC